MTIDIRETDYDDAAESWDPALEAAAQGGFLQSFCWAELTKQAYDYTPTFLNLFEDDERLAVALVLRQCSGTRTRSLRGRLAKPFTHYLNCSDGPIYFAPERQRPAHYTALADWLSAQAKAQRCRMVRYTPYVSLNAELEPFAPELVERNYRATRRGTYLVDLQSAEDDIWGSFHRSIRKSVGKCERQGIVVRRLSCADYFKTYTAMELDFGRPGQPPWLTEFLAQHERSQPHYHYYVAYHDETPVATLGMFCFGGVAREIASSTSTYAMEQKIYAQDLLHWESIRAAKAIGCHTFDLAGVAVGAMSPKEEGIKRFKAKWNGRYVEYDVYTHNRYPKVTKVLGKLRTGIQSKQ